jgi:hypothetical protein
MHSFANRFFLRLVVIALVAVVGEAPAAAAANFGATEASPDTRRVADWVVASGDNGGLPFVIIDKLGARVFVFDHGGSLRGSAPALLGLTRGDDSPPGIGDRKLANIGPDERITPAGRFVAALGRNLGGQDILWIDYATAVSLHRVVTSKKAERRGQRLASMTTLDNRISYGCINVPVAFYETMVRPAFAATAGIVYIMPEKRSIAEVFGTALTNSTTALP